MILSLLMASYFVANAGSNSNSGTSSGSPWQTIAHAVAAVAPGDTINLNGGDTFSENVLLDSIATSAGNAITLQAYGAGTPTIAGGTGGAAIKVRNMGYVTIQNLALTCAAVTTSGTFPSLTASTTATDAVIKVQTDNTAIWYDQVNITNCTTSGGQYGIWYFASQTSATAAFRNCTISNCTIDSTGVAGIMTEGLSAGSNVHVGVIFNTITVQTTKVSNVYGLTAYVYPGLGSNAQTGFGIYLGSCTSSLVYRCYVTNCGSGSVNTASGGPTGIIFVETTSSTIRECEVDTVRCPEHIDGNGIDLDAGCSSCIIERCYVHGCDGDGLLGFQSAGFSTWTNNQFRFNVLEKNGQRTVGSMTGGIRVGTSSATGLSILNNTIWFDCVGAPTKAIDANAADMNILNNLFSIGGSGAVFGSIVSGPTLLGNTYHVRTGASFSLNYAGVGYVSLAGLQGTGVLEKVGSTTYGASGDPTFTSGGGGSVQWPNPPSSLTAYNIPKASISVGAGYDPSGVSVSRGTKDFHLKTLSATFASGAVDPNGTSGSGRFSGIFAGVVR